MTGVGVEGGFGEGVQVSVGVNVGTITLVGVTGMAVEVEVEVEVGVGGTGVSVGFTMAVAVAVSYAGPGDTIATGRNSPAIIVIKAANSVKIPPTIAPLIVIGCLLNQFFGACRFFNVLLVPPKE